MSCDNDDLPIASDSFSVRYSYSVSYSALKGLEAEKGITRILEISNQKENFDSYRIDDVCMVFRNEKYYMYYKGRPIEYGAVSNSTKMEVAIGVFLCSMEADKLGHIY